MMSISHLLLVFLLSGDLWGQVPPPPPPPPGPVAEGISPSGDQSVDPMGAVGQVENFDLFLEPYNYDPSGRRDPFLRIGALEELPQAISSGGQQRPLLPLERFELVDIRLIGIIWNINSPRAMFKDPTNKIHILSKDQRIGRNQGYIAVIRESEVVVVETSEKNGEPIYSTKVLRLIK